MPKTDYAHRMTDRELAALEKRIAAEYKKAADEMQGKVDAYFQSLAKRDAETKALIGTIVNGKKYTEQDYKQWRLTQIGRGKRLEALRDRLAERMTRANEVTAAYINDDMPKIYAMNRAYIIKSAREEAGEILDGVDFALWDERTVKRLLIEQPDLMPHYPKKRAVKRGIDLDYGKRKITEYVTQGILQGESINQMARKLMDNVEGMERVGAIRAARTAITAAENAGRQAGREELESKGVIVRKRWIANDDNRSRERRKVKIHVEAGEQPPIDNDMPFEVGGEYLMFPGDSSMGASGWNLYNCRCSSTAEIVGFRSILADEHQGMANARVSANFDVSENGREALMIVKSTENAKNEQNIQKLFSQSVGSFTPASTIEEAESYAKQFVSTLKSKYSGNVSYKGLSVETANEINRTISQIYEAFDVERMANISVMNKRDKTWKNTTAEASYRWGSTGGIFINQAYYKDAKSLDAHQREVQETLNYILSQADVAQRVAKGKQKEYLEALLKTGRTNVGGINAGDTVMHEMGHFLDDSIFGLQKTSSSFDLKSSMGKYAGGISGYATANSAEYVAESFTAWAKGETDILDPELIKIFEGATKWKK